VGELMAGPNDQIEGFRALTPEELAARKRRSLVIALGLIGFLTLVFVITLVRLGPDALGRPF
jgi:hypothetical protein